MVLKAALVVPLLGCQRSSCKCHLIVARTDMPLLHMPELPKHICKNLWLLLK